MIRESLELNRDQIATRLGINKAIYDHAERGTTFPNVEFLAALSQKLKVNLAWLVTGEGEMFMEITKVTDLKAPTIPNGLMKKLGRVAYTTYRDANIKLPPEEIAELAAELYKKLQELVQNINDSEEVELTLPLLKLHLKRQIEAERVHLKATQDTA
ncbi:transcriptional regulator [Bartonella vinsonii subsp. berkhoffii str. Tweed]|uniref:Transcriptional regulator n=1 Tax=Bartonella vinsonii subsp. berkhoffii str. Tweed TaxID=1094502 RepID=N6VKM6_BARVB|nr:helix-turn-helix transcriptional regulator [Bartonella vinsonii]ENN94455.1 transcriptional regulator [Bartonella vinsonii subsp. berkhoffii str. Tweed]